MDLSSYLAYAVSLELGNITNDHTQLDRVTRAKVPYGIVFGVWILSAFVNTEYEHRFLPQLIFKELSTRFITPCFPARKKNFPFSFLKGTFLPSIIKRY